jgi:hypothetical protein
MDEFDNKLCGCVLALLTGMARDATERVSEALQTFADDRNTPASEAAFYRDLAESIEIAPAPVWDIFEQLEVETLH